MDVFSYAMTLLELLLGAAPWSVELAANPELTMVKLAYKVANDSGRPAIPSGVPPFVRTLIISCWEQDPALRLGMAEVVGRLERYDTMHRAAAMRCKPGGEPDDSSQRDDFGPLETAVRLPPRRGFRRAAVTLIHANASRDLMTEAAQSKQTRRTMG